jgi:hypothetical protein
MLYLAALVIAVGLAALYLLVYLLVVGVRAARRRG